MIRRAYKYRIYPTKEQAILMAKHFGCVRWIYNWGLDQRKRAYEQTGKSPSAFTQGYEIKELKLLPETEWLRQVNADSLYASLLNLDSAYRKFFREGRGFPNFKSKNNKQSFSSPHRSYLKNGKLSITKFREGIKIKLTRSFEGKIKTVMISKTSSGKYFASMLVETPDEPIIPQQPRKDSSVGIDLGIKTFAVLSTGEEIANPRHLKSSLKRLKRLQRNLSRKVKGSNNRLKAKRLLAIQHEKVTNRRKDFLHKVSTKLIRENQTICLEDLNVKGMTQNHKLAQALSDISIGTFNQFLEYKALWYGTNLLRCGRFEPSSKTCNACGTVNNNLTLKDRTWTCVCGSHHDRDINAAKNIRDFCFVVRGESPEFTLAESSMSTLVEARNY